MEEYLKRDPEEERSYKRERGRHHKTQISVIASEEFVECLYAVMERVMTARRDGHVLKWIGLFCKGGNHRADVCSRTFVDIISRILNEHNERVFRVKLFLPNLVHNEAAVKRMVTEFFKFAYDAQVPV